MSIIYQWGSLITPPSQQSITLKIKVPQKVEEVHCGGSHFIAKTQSKIYGFGINNYGQLGYQQDQQKTQLIELKIRTEYMVKQIACGENHTLILDQIGDVYSCGQGTYGALGYQRGSNAYNFNYVIGGILQISAGKQHSLAISVTKVYGWGNSKDNQLGLLKQKIYYQPQQLFVFQSYYCYAGSRFSYFATSQGLYATGYNQGGILGLGHEKKVRMPKKVNFGSVVKKIRSGDYSVIESEEGQFYISGKGCFGQFLYPTKVKHLKQCESVEIGQGFGTIIHKDNTISTWNQKNQPTPQYNQFLMELNLEDLKCSSNSCLGYSYTVQKQFSKKNIMAKSAISNTEIIMNPHANKYQKRKQSDASKYRFNTDLSNFQQVDSRNCLNTQLSNMRQNQVIKIDRASIQRGLISNRIFTNRGQAESRQVCSNQIEQIQLKSVETPLFMRKGSNSVANKSIEGSEEQKAEGSSRICLKEAYALASSKLNFIRQQDQIILPEKLQLTQKIQFLEMQNRKKDEQLRKVKNDFLQLLDIVESDMALRNILKVKNPNYIEQKRVKFGQSKTDRFTENITELRKLLTQTQNLSQIIQ